MSERTPTPPSAIVLLEASIFYRRAVENCETERDRRGEEVHPKPPPDLAMVGARFIELRGRKKYENQNKSIFPTH